MQRPHQNRILAKGKATREKKKKKTHTIILYYIETRMNINIPSYGIFFQKEVRASIPCKVKWGND